MKKKLRKIPFLKDENEVFEFWSRHDSANYVDWSRAKRGLFPNLQNTTKLISIRFPVSDLDRIKALARHYDMPYQTLIKKIVSQAVERKLEL